MASQQRPLSPHLQVYRWQVQMVTSILHRATGLFLAWLAGKVTGKARARVLEDIASGRAQVVVGTHALIEDNVVFRNLGLAVIDEQQGARIGLGAYHAATGLDDLAQAGVQVWTILDWLANCSCCVRP
mgnify:CR=1 FL=1